MAAVKLLSVPKAGSTRAEYEDAGAWNVCAGRYAVADGATESSFAGRWATALVDHFVESDGPVPSGADVAAWLVRPEQRWSSTLDTARLPWYAEAKAQAGAFAALLGLVLRPTRSGNGRWHAVAVGDSCLLHLRCHNGALRLRRGFPLDRSAAFGRSPLLLCSRPSANVGLSRHVRTSGGWYRRSDVFILATDALAQSLLLADERGNPCWDQLCAGDETTFAPWVAERRAAHLLRNDDTTALIVLPGVSSRVARVDLDAWESDQTVSMDAIAAPSGALPDRVRAGNGDRVETES